MNNKPLKKSVVKTFLLGYDNANKFIQEEKIKRLRKLTSEESLREYEELCKTWEVLDTKDGLKKLEKSRIGFLVKRRNLLSKINANRE